jgi:DNA invertase Pin-like site-specific DNA recombinase
MELSTRRAIAYFRCSLQDGQENVSSIQRDHVRQWAHDHGIEIVREFCDIGPSGAGSTHRPAFTDMMGDRINRRSDFEYVLYFEACRLDRCASGDFAEYPPEVVHQHKKKLIYTLNDKPQVQ